VKDAGGSSAHATLATSPQSERIRRFTLGTRLLHWLNALPFIALLITGLLIYLPAVKAVSFGAYRFVPLLHVIFGIAWMLAPLALLAVLRRRRAVLDDVAGSLTPARGDVDWLRYASLTLLGARVRQPPTGKYNAGQKLNSWYWILASTALALTGVVLAVNFFTKRVFDAAFVERVFPLHELVALISLAPLAGHLYLTLINRATRPSLPGMITGEVDAAWAAEHHSAWAKEESAGAT